MDAKDLDFYRSDGIRKNGSFGIRNQRMIFTYKYHLDKDDVKRFLSLLMKLIVNNLVFYECVHDERHESIDVYNHTHLLVNFGYQFRSENPRIFDYNHNGEIIRPRLRFINTCEWDDAVRYIKTHQ